MKKINKLIIIFLLISSSIIAQTNTAYITIKVKAYNSTFGGGCKNDLRVELKFSDNTYQTIIETIDLNNASSSSYHTYSNSIPFPANKTVVALRTRTSRNWHRTIGGCGGNGSFNDSYETHNISNSYCTSNNNDIARWWIVNSELYITPDISLTTPTDEAISVAQDESFNVGASTGFPDDRYQWQYYIPGDDTVTTTPSQCAYYCAGGGGGTDGVQEGLTASQCQSYNDSPYCNSSYTPESTTLNPNWHNIIDGNLTTENILDGVTPNDIPNLNGYVGNIHFRIKYCNDDSSNFVQYTILPSPPHFTQNDIDVHPRTCSYSDDEYLIIQLDRSLRNGEELRYSIVRNNGDLMGNGVVTSLTTSNQLIITPSTNANLNALESGTYQITVYTNENGISGAPVGIVENFTISNPTPVQFTTTVTNPVCHGDQGSVTLVAFGGTYNSYSYSLNPNMDGGAWTYFNNGNSTTISLPSGAHTITIKDGNNCQSQPQTITIEAAPSKIVFTEEKHQPTANGFHNGWVAIAISGGTGTYNSNSINWSPLPSGATVAFDSTENKATLSGIGAGTYTLTGQDSGGCDFEYTVTLEEPQLLALSITESSPISCNSANMPDTCSTCNQDGVLTATATGGVSPYDFIWKDSNGITLQTTNNVAVNPNNGQATDTLSNLGAGTYQVNIIDANGITIGNYNMNTGQLVSAEPIDFSLTEPEAIGISIPQTGIHNVSCYDGNDGYIHPNSITGGAGNNNFRWVDSTNQIIGSNLYINNLSAGVYTLIVTDANGCMASTDVTISQPQAPISISYTYTEPLAAGASNGQIVATVTGGTPNYTYVWTNANGDNLNASTSFVSNTNEFVITLDQIPAGDYHLQITDSKNCTYDSSFTLQEPRPLVIDHFEVVSPISCYEESDGVLQVFGDGGVVLEATQNNGLDYYYTWYKKDVNGVFQALIYQTDLGEDLGVGVYKVIITDKNNNTAEAIYSFSQPEELRLDEIIVTNNTCYEGQDGAIEIDINGGTSPYIYLWEDENGNEWNTQSIYNLPAGTYNLYVEDAHGCSIFYPDVTITQPNSAISIELINIVNPSAFGVSDGSIEVNIQGGTPTYSYKWEDENDITIAETQNINNLADGSYTLSVTDSYGCFTSETFLLEEPPLLSVTIVENENITCYNEQTGVLFANVTGGVTPYDYEWFKLIDGSYITLNETNDTLINLVAATYRVIVTDANGVETMANYTLEQPTDLIASINQINNVACYGESTGSIDINVSGGTPPYTFIWDDANNSNTKDIANLPFGTYNVMIVDANSCTTELNSISITQPEDPLSINNEVLTNLTGFQTNNGQINLQVTGGTSPYSFQWSGPNNFSSNQAPPINNLEAGEYSVTITDANLCDVSETYTITEPDILTFSLNQTLFNLCNGDTNAEIVANVSGGVSPYIFNWTYQEDTSLIFSNTNTISNLLAGTYTLLVIDANNNQFSDSILITQNDPIVISSNSSHMLLCNGANNGVINIEVSGGTGNYSYNWNNGESTQNLSNLAAGIYTVTVHDGNNCSESFTFELNEPTPIEVSNVVYTEPLGNGLQNGSIEVSVIGGTPSYSFEWFDNNNITIPNQNTNILSNVGAGTYSVIITDSNGCSLEQNFNLLEPEPLLLEVSFEPILCNGEQTTMSVSASGGVGEYTYQWLDNLNNIISSNSETPLVNAGTYQIIVTDENGITNSENITLSEPDALQINLLNIDDLICENTATGNIDIEVLGGTGTYIYSWSNGAYTQDLINVPSGTYHVQITDENNCTLTSQDFVIEESTISIENVELIQPSIYGASDGSITVDIVGNNSDYQYQWYEENANGIFVVLANETSNSLNNIGEGNYKVVIVNNIGCTLEQIYTLGQPDPLTVSILQTNTINCFNDNSASLNATAQGGVGGYIYTWYNADTNEVIVGENSSSIDNLGIGNYYVIVTDLNNAQIQSETIEIVQPQEITVTTNFENSTCFNDNNGSISVIANGGTDSFLYRIKQGTNNYSDWIPFSNVNTLSISDLAPDNYYIQIKDTNNCFYIIDGNIQTLLFSISEPDLLEVNNSTIIEPTGFGLSNASIEVEVLGGTSPYQYQWTDANGIVLPSTSNLIENLIAGTYTLTVIDNNFCTLSTNFIITQPDPLQAEIAIQNPILCNNETGSINVIVSGGVPYETTNDYTYEWYLSGENTILSTTSLLENVGAGNYFVVVTDANNNTITSEIFSLEEPNEMELEFNATYTGCGTENDWEIQVNVTGGTAPYTYSWNTGDNSNTISNVTPGTYLVIVLDANGCEIIQNYTVELPELLEVESTISPISCFNACDGEINLNIIGGVPPYNINWEDGSNQINRTDLCTGDYSVEITDQKGCVLNYEFTLDNPEEIMVNISQERITLCSGQSIELNLTLDQTGVTYLWESDNGFYSTNPVVLLEDEGIYTATITDNNGCSNSKQIEIILSDVGISAQFLLTSQAFADEDVILINTSNPIGENTQWIIPDEVSIVEQTNETITLHFTEEGIYEIGLETQQGDCNAIYTKNIQVNEARDLPDIGDAESPFISEFVAYPNPNSGNFTASIVLKQEAEISLRLFSLISNTPLDDRQFSSQDTYQVDYTDLNLSSGVYYLLLETPNGSEIRKVIIE